jgi:hypothetical protein
MRIAHKYMLVLTTVALFAGVARPALADDDPPPPIPAYCLDDQGNLLPLEGCPGFRQATGH